MTEQKKQAAKRQATGSSKKTAKKSAKKKKKSTRKKATKRAHKYTAKTADKHLLYQLSVQAPDFEVDLITRIFKRVRGRKPLSLREDFCGTALLCGHWVESAADRTALGVDIDQSVLDWGIEHNLSPIGEPGKRIKLLAKDVRDKIPGKNDVCVAFNFSYWYFQEREVMRKYFEGVRKGLAKDGLFFLDAYGGYESHEPDLTDDPRKFRHFTYVWEQDKVDPINNTVTNHIHFEFPDGTRMNKAFTYHWRFWSLREIKELLLEAGFKNVTVYWEDDDDVYRPRKTVANQPSWIVYITAEN